MCDANTGTFKLLWERHQFANARMDDLPGAAGIHTIRPFDIKDSTTVEVLVEGYTAWGIRFLNVDDTERTVVRLRCACPISKVEKIETRDYEIHSVLGVDIDFLHMVVGLQNCASSYPCYVCKILLSTLKSRNAPMTAGEKRTAKRANQQLTAVLTHTLKKDQRKEAKLQGSQLNRALIPAGFSCLLLAPLHIILDITKMMWDEKWNEFVLEVQDVDDRLGGRRKELLNVRDAVAANVAFVQA
jgi:hypothetical protein